MTMDPIDLNADLGEGIGSDADLLPLVSSANISCGCHAGDPLTMWHTLRLAVEHHVHIGAHPGYPDRDHFGRRELERDSDHLFAELTYQIGALMGLAQTVGGTVGYVKPHGALYNQACRDIRYAVPIVAVAKHFGLGVVGLPNSELARACEGQCEFFPEGFADRRYRDDGSLVPRSEPNAFVTDPDEALQQVERLITLQRIRTICVHGDNPRAIDFVRLLREALTRAGYPIQAFS